MSNLKINLLLEMLDRVSGPARRMGQNMSASLERVSKRAQEAGKRISDIGKSVSLKVSAPLAGLTGLALKTSANFERMGIALKTSFQGDEEAARAALEQIKEFAATSPFQIEEIMNSFIRLKNMGLDPGVEAMTAYGDMASAFGVNITDMVAAVTGATTGEFERLKAFGIRAEVAGKKVRFTFQGVSEVVGKNSKEIEGYLRRLAEEKFAGGMIDQSKSLGGAFSNLEDAVSFALGGLGDEIVRSAGIKEFLRGLSDFIDRLTKRFQALSPETRKFISWAILIGVALGPVLIAVGQLTIGIAGLMLVMSKLGLVLSAGGIAAWFTAFGGKLMFVATTAIPLVVTALRAMTLAVVGNPVTVFLVALGAVAVALMAQWEPFRKFWKALWAEVKLVVAEAWNFIKPIVDALGNAYRAYAEIGQTIGGFAGGVIRYATTGEIGSKDAPQPNIIQPQLLAPAAQRQQVDTTSTVRLELSDERVRVKEARTNDPRQKIEVETGLLMGGF